jgi:hypothetical protein
VALLTDVGNDLLYEVPVPDILGWVETCVQRLQRVGARIVVTPLPLRGIQAVSPTKYALIRTTLFPRCRRSYPEMVQQAEELDRQLHDLVGKWGLLLAEPRAEWYGFDVVHIRRRYWATAWAELLSAWPDRAASPAAAPLSLGRGLALRLLAPEQRWLLGWEQRRSQPAAKLADGTTLSVY